MVSGTKRGGAMVLRLMVGLALLGWPRVGSAQGTWSVISLPQRPGEIVSARALAVDTAGNLYISEFSVGRVPWIQKRDALGNWSIIASSGTAVGQVAYPTALSADPAGNLYVADGPGPGYRGRIQKRDAQGNWSVIAAAGEALGQVYGPHGLAADAAGNLYIADDGGNGRIQKRDAQGNWSVIATARAGPLAVDAAGNLYAGGGPIAGGAIQKRDAQGNWSVIATVGTTLGQALNVSAFAVDGVGSLYAADYSNGPRIQKRDALGNWSVIATAGTDIHPVQLSSLAADAAGNLYLTDNDGNSFAPNRIEKRDAQGNWSVLTTRYGDTAGQSVAPTALAVDAAGNLYVAEIVDWNTWNSRIQKRDAQGNWSVIATSATPYYPLAADTGGNLYVGGVGDDGTSRIQKRGAQGDWSVIATTGDAVGFRNRVSALTVDSAGNLYAADVVFYPNDESVYSARIQKRDAHGNWSVIGTYGPDSEGYYVSYPTALAVDAAGNLYVAESRGGWIQKRDAQGNWSVIPSGQFVTPTALAVDTAGNLYVADSAFVAGAESRVGIQKRDAQGNWSVIATFGTDPGQFTDPSGLAVDGAGSLYATDSDTHRVQKYTPGR